MIKKIFAILMGFPAIGNLLKKSMKTGKIDPVETLNALSSISPSTQKVADTAINAVQQGGGIPDVMRAMTNVGKVKVMGQELDTRTMVQDLKRTGGFCSVLANMLEKMQSQSPEEIVEFGKQAGNIQNWQEIINQ